MTPELYQRLKPLYEAALEIPKENRAQFVAMACQNDDELRVELEALLIANDRETGTFGAPFIKFEDLLAGPERTFADGELIDGRFSIVRHLGTGGMGEVYEAVDLELGRIALKTIRSSVLTNPQQLSRFKKEVQLARRVSSRHVCRIHELFLPDGPAEEPQTAFLTMEFLEGITLTDKVHKDGPLPWREARTIAVEICEALQCIHEEEIIHRDLKGRNIMLASRKGTACAVLMDFGIAHELSPHTGDTSTALIREGAVLGTPGYIAPEQFEGKDATPATDVYALGIVLYECVTAQRPFSREQQANGALVKATSPPRMSSIRPGVPRRFDDVVCKCLEYDPKRRYQTAKEVERALRGTSLFPWLTQRPIAMTAAAVILLFVLSCVLLIPAVGERVRGILFSTSQKHIVVLPFEVAGDNPQTQALADGLMDSLAGRISNLDTANKTLWVVPAAEVRSRKVNDPTAALRQFGAKMVVAGKFERNDQSTRLRLTLIDPQKARELGYVDVESQTGDMAALQDEAVTRLGRLMNISTGPNQAQNNGKPITRAAYEDYLAGVGYLQRYDKVGNIDLAVKSLESAVTTDPHLALGFARLGEVYTLKYRLESNPQWLKQAEVYGRKAAELDDQAPSTYVALGGIHELTGNHELAIHEFQRALALDPRDVEALAGIAGAYQNAGRFPEAETHYIRVTALRPDDWKGYNDLGIFYEGAGRPLDAIPQFKRALMLSPDNSWLYTNLGMTYMDFDDPKMLGEAESELHKSIAIEPSFVAYSDLSLLYAEQHRFDESVVASKAGIKLNERGYQPWYNLAVAYEWLKEDGNADAARGKAIELLEDSVKIDPQDFESQATLAALYAKNGSRKKAIEKINISLALSPDNQYVLSQVADAYELIGERKQAITYLRKAIARGLNKAQLNGDPEIQGVLSDPAFQGSGT